MKRFLKSAGKWLLILGGVWLVTLYLSGVDFETRTGWYLFALAMGIAYLDGTQKDKIAALEYRIKELERRLDGSPKFPFV
jgi:hypothetical protein